MLPSSCCSCRASRARPAAVGLPVEVSLPGAHELLEEVATDGGGVGRVGRVLRVERRQPRLRALLVLAPLLGVAAVLLVEALEALQPLDRLDRPADPLDDINSRAVAVFLSERVHLSGGGRGRRRRRRRHRARLAALFTAVVHASRVLLVELRCWELVAAWARRASPSSACAIRRTSSWPTRSPRSTARTGWCARSATRRR